MFYNIIMKNCLMIETKDHKKFFTQEENLPQLIVFSKVFNAEISVVQVQDENIVLDLEKLAPALCEKNDCKSRNYKLLKVKIKSKRNKTLSRAKKIQKYITKTLLDGKIVSLRELNKKYKKYQLTTACLCIHLRKTRENLEKQGYKAVKVGGGKYKVEPPVSL